jgi:signal transduction histidine kinase
MCRLVIASIILSLAGIFTGLAADWQAPMTGLPLLQLETRLTAIDRELQHLARYSLRSGVGSIGYRSIAHTNSANREWVQIMLGDGARFDELVLVPVICHDTKQGLRSDGFPTEFRILAGSGADTNGTVLAAFGTADRLLPRIAPVVIPCPATTASWVRVEATVLSPRAFDGRYNLELAEILVFDGPDNVALNRPVRVSSSEGAENWPRHPSRVVDGFTPFLMHSAQGASSIAYLSQPLAERLPASLMIDLGAPYPLNRIHLHAIDVDDVIPQSHSYDFCLPSHLTIEGANRPDFSDAAILTTFHSRSPYDRGPLIMLRFPETECRYVRLTVLDLCKTPVDDPRKPEIGFAEIELFSKGENIALHRRVVTSFPSTEEGRSLARLTDGANFYGRILPLREWMEQLACRHDLDNERILVAQEITRRYTRQKVLLQRMTWLAALLVAGLAFTILVDRLLRLRVVARVKERLAADLHDEIGANLHTIGMLSDLAGKAKESPEKLAMLLGRIRSMTERSGTAVRHFADLLDANEMKTDLATDIRRASERIMARFDQDVAIEGEEHLRKLSPGTAFDLFLFYKECLVNISRHSGATRFSTRLSATGKQVELTVNDNGHGVAGYGEGKAPKSLLRRAKLLGARMAVERPEDGGTRVTLTLRSRRWGRL